jgi:glutaredoxin
MSSGLQNEIADLLTDTGAAHHQAFSATNGEDADWPIWYAEHLQRSLGALLHADFTRSQLVYCVMNAEFERAARAPDADWSRYYAEHFAERFAPTGTATADKLSLYYFPSCPFCVIVRSTIDQLGLDVEFRDIHEDGEHREALIAERGRATVPVLQIESPDGDLRWMPESRDIVRYLNSTYG